MLTHHRDAAAGTNRVVVLGAAGFIGAAATVRLAAAGWNVLPQSRKDIDLLAHDASARIATSLRADDSLVVIAARAPVKNNAMLLENVQMMAAICEAISTVRPCHVVYVSSDAVYGDSTEPLTESSCAQPGSLHGAMHATRERMLAEAYAGPLCILRPTLVYGPRDPHNGYGPNRFRRSANAEGEIALFGDGEERRDHVYVDDVAELIHRCVARQSSGTLNVTTGVVTSFKEIAERVAKLSPKATAINRLPRSGPMPHGGYRAFDAGSTFEAFPGFEYTPLETGLAVSQREEYANG